MSDRADTTAVWFGKRAEAVDNVRSSCELIEKS